MNIGKPVIWTKEACIQDAKNYPTKPDWYQTPSYMAAQVKGWVRECSEHMPIMKKIQEFTKEECIEDALTFKNREAYRFYSKSYSWASNCGYLDDCYHQDGSTLEPHLVEFFKLIIKTHEFAYSPEIHEVLKELNYKVSKETYHKYFRQLYAYGYLHKLPRIMIGYRGKKVFMLTRRGINLFKAIKKET